VVRLIASTLLLLAVTTLAARAAQETDWDATWDELERVVAKPDEGDGPAARARLAVLAAREGADPRGRILAAWLERAAGRALTIELTAAEVDEVSPRAAWLAARVMADGPARDRALTRALEGLPAAQVAEVYGPAYQRYVALADSYQTERALVLARALHARAQALWSAINLANSLRRTGRFDEARAVLTEQLERTRDDPDRAELLQARALVAAAAGWRGRERDDLGAALAHGSVDAAVVLGRLALSEGHPGRARAVFRSVLREDPPQAWALRGWGLSMLPRARGRL
jgi:tetratricopeptide (TPR) repeat protein